MTGEALVEQTTFEGEEATRYPLARAKQGVLVAGMLVLTAAGNVIALLGEPLIGGSIAVAGGAMAVVNGVALLRPRGIVLTPTRLVAVLNRRHELSWDEVEGVELDSRRSRVIVIRTASQAIRLPADVFTSRPEEIVAAIEDRAGLR
ncbi:hypothetical protein OJ997_02320 [Solirubrobacter phytolaccae]|uniref:PH domain-containing protein n=1 Tax=Solirubrobacter phytolaccae TaxID=1404360 RepID=A0A9X3N439_9ACTN|nr:hypothetical protein [Solirubrobacter phytolaccae]MDA0179116.1 hypothetical protein [Solirubrobacter phytolaccae]